MNTSRIDLILHPARLRILMALAGRELTPQALAEILKDIPQASLYRHLNRLVKAGILRVVSERQVRGTVEKVYALDQAQSYLTEADMAGLSKDDHIRYFVAFVASLLSDFQRYLDTVERVNMAADAVGYHKHIVELSDEEVERLGKALQNAFREARVDEPSSPRRRRVFSTTLMPYIENEENPDVR